MGKLDQPSVIRRNTFAQRPDGDDQTLMKRVGAIEQALGENFRDTDDAKRASAVVYRIEEIGPYTEPMFLTLPSEPQGGIVLARIRKFPDDGLPVVGGGMVHFDWDSSANRARIKSIDGLTPSPTQKYTFSFAVVT
jgi:hypothetical protein